MICPGCGTTNEPAAQFCRACGAGLASGGEGAGAWSTDDTGDAGGLGWLGVLFFCIPPVGAVMYFVWKEESPRKSQRACSLALLGFFTGLAVQIGVGIFQVMTGD